MSEFFPVLEATWEARARVRVVGGSLMGTSEMFQLLTMGCDERFVSLLTEQLTPSTPPPAPVFSSGERID